MKERLLISIYNNKLLIKNFSYISILQVFILISPLITYPYLTRVLGLELYGWVITAQVVASYFSIFIGFGFNTISAKHISIHRNDKKKLSEIVSSILIIRSFLWVVFLLIYIILIFNVFSYKEHALLFIFSYLLTFNDLLFPQFYFQGIEQMKFITIVSILIRLVFVVLTFIVVREQADYIFVPLIMSIGYFIGGIVSLYIIFVKHDLHFFSPNVSILKYYIKDVSLIFTTQIITTIKDKLNYILLGAFVGMSDVTVYDIGSKLCNLLTQITGVISTVTLPKMAINQNNKLFKKILALIFVVILFEFLGVNTFLPQLVSVLTKVDINLDSIRLYLFAPLFLSISSFLSTNFLIARGYNLYVLKSIIVTTSFYLLFMSILYFSGNLNSVISFVSITVASFFIEMVYRIVVVTKLVKNSRYHS